MEKFEVCVCVVEKTNGSGYENVRFKDVILTFDDYADAIKCAGKYAEKMRKSARYASEDETR
ncbi:hypothetical protein IBX38_00375 [Candidatus Bathyarchaeota archaeon]|nr:hypothetical protein [Candidatus Bathyarchaeota archaeon]